MMCKAISGFTNPRVDSTIFVRARFAVIGEVRRNCYRLKTAFDDRAMAMMYLLINVRNVVNVQWIISCVHVKRLGAERRYWRKVMCLIHVWQGPVRDP
jgi:hypothetical protein